MFKYGSFRLFLIKASIGLMVVGFGLIHFVSLISHNVLDPGFKNYTNDMSLSEVSKINVPVVIDTPLGRLDSKHRKQLITKYFPQAGSQTIILSTDEEIIGDYYKSLKPYIGNEYLCDENKKTKNGRIVEGYFK